MAQVIDKIVRSKYPPRDTRVLWFDTTDDSLKSFTSKGWDKVSTKIMENITYSQLKYLRDNSKLIPGCYYRITDYQCTTSQVNTKSAGHQFDIIVRADSENKLNEEASAIQHEGDEYFANNNLNAWQIWYCLDNDTTRFEWADSINGKGVIYRMIDEWNNDVPYDFKNIQFYRKFNFSTYLWSDIPKDNTGVPCYTFSSEGKYSTTSSFTDMSLSKSNRIYSNIIKKYINSNIQILNNNCFFGESCHDNYFENSCYNNTLGNWCYDNIFGNDCNSNSIDENCGDNFFEDSCDSNNIDKYCSGNFLEEGCASNSFDRYCNNNFLGKHCSRNKFYMSCSNNNLGDSCNDNTFDSYCSSNLLKNSCYHNSIGQSCYSNILGFNSSYNSIGKYCYNNAFGNFCSSNTIGESCSYNSFGNHCSYNIFGNNFNRNSLGNNCESIEFSYSKGDTTKFNYYQYNYFGNGCKYILLRGIETASSTAQVQNYKFAQGLQGTSDNYLAIDGVRNRAYETKVAKNSNGELKIYCEADLVQ